MTPGQESAARLAGAVWAALTAAGGPSAPRLLHCPAALDQAFLTALPLPGQHSVRPPATLGTDGDLVRHPGHEAMKAALARYPTTRVHEDIGWDGDGDGNGNGTGWARLTAQHLTRLAGPPRVTVAAYQSAHGARELGRHQDMWLGIIIQVSGAKHWQAGPCLLTSETSGQHHVTLAAGDILIVPKGLPHQVTTPARPGHSTHLGLSLFRDLDGPARRRPAVT